MPTVSYVCTHRLLTNPGTQQGHSVSRPWVEVEVTYGGQSRRLFCLVDSGSDATILDLGTANQFGVQPHRLPQSHVSGVGPGGAPFGVLQGVTLDFAGVTVTNANVLVGSTPLPILGRATMFDPQTALEIGLDELNWHHT